MQVIFIFIAFVAIFANFMLGGPSGTAQNATSSIKAASVIGTATGTAKPQEPTPSFLIETFVISGPKDGAVVATSSRIVFKFNGITTPEQDKKISYETKIIGLDSKWQLTNSNERTVDFPGGDREYTFLVRAKVGGFYDETPAETTFFVKNSISLAQIKFSSVSNNLIILNTNFPPGESVDITGWKISGKYSEFVIPQGLCRQLIVAPAHEQVAAAAEENLRFIGQIVFFRIKARGQAHGRPVRGDREELAQIHRFGGLDPEGIIISLVSRRCPAGRRWYDQTVVL